MIAARAAVKLANEVLLLLRIHTLDSASSMLAFLHPLQVGTHFTVSEGQKGDIKLSTFKLKPVLIEPALCRSYGKQHTQNRKIVSSELGHRRPHILLVALSGIGRNPGIGK